MTNRKPIAERFAEGFKTVQFNGSHHPFEIVENWLRLQTENKKKLFSIEEVEQIAQEAWKANTNACDNCIFY